MKSAFALSFLRPIYKAVIKGQLVLVLVQWSRQGGNRQVFIGIGGLKTSTATAAMPCTQGIALVVEDESPL